MLNISFRVILSGTIIEKEAIMKREYSAKELLVRVKTKAKKRANKRAKNQVKRLEKRLAKTQAN
jgi:hypothetical protein